MSQSWLFLISFNVFFMLQVMERVMETFQPCAVVLQNGADSLNGDRLGTFNLTLRGNIFPFEEIHITSHFSWTSVLHLTTFLNQIWYFYFSFLIYFNDSFLFRSWCLCSILPGATYSTNDVGWRWLYTEKCGSMLDLRDFNCCWYGSLWRYVNAYIIGVSEYKSMLRSIFHFLC